MPSRGMQRGGCWAEGLADVGWKVLHRFTVDGDPVGYYALGKHPNWKRRQQYHDYKRSVQRAAELAGVGRLVATADVPLLIHCRAYFRTRVHPDPENVRKGVCDALFYRRRGRGCADKYCGGSFPPPLYDPSHPRVEVTIEQPIQPPHPEEEATGVCNHGRGCTVGDVAVACELEAGHAGPHRFLYGHSVFEWEG